MLVALAEIEVCQLDTDLEFNKHFSLLVHALRKHPCVCVFFQRHQVETLLSSGQVGCLFGEYLRTTWEPGAATSLTTHRLIPYIAVTCAELILPWPNRFLSLFLFLSLSICYPPAFFRVVWAIMSPFLHE